MIEYKRKSFDNFRKWLSNKTNAGIFASILGIVASELLLPAKILVIASSRHTNLCSYLETIWCFISSLLFFLAFCGLKKQRESIVLIFIFSQGITLFFVGINALFLLFTLIIRPGCGRYYWPFGTKYCDYEGTPITIEFQYTGYGTLIYFVLSFALYRTIWRAYKFLKMANIKPDVSHVTIPAICNTSYVTENCSTAPAPTLPTTFHRLDEQQNHSLGDWPTFFDHMKCVEHERNVLRAT